MPSARVVLDTNVLISRALLPNSIPAQAVCKAMAQAYVLVSMEVMADIADVLARPKFDKYVSVADRQAFVRSLGSVAQLVPITRRIQACRDPKDDKFLELAVNGEAHCIVTGDNDLLALNPFQGIEILTPKSYLERT